MSMKTTLMEEYDNTYKAMKKMQYGSDEFKAASAHFFQLSDRIERILEFEKEQAAKMMDREKEDHYKAELLRFERRKELIRNIITIGTSAASLAVLIWGTFGTWAFDAKHTSTSTMGRGWLNMLLPKWLKQ